MSLGGTEPHFIGPRTTVVSNDCHSVIPLLTMVIGKPDHEARSDAGRGVRENAFEAFPKGVRPGIAFRRGGVCQKRIAESRAIWEILRR